MTERCKAIGGIMTRSALCAGDIDLDCAQWINRAIGCGLRFMIDPAGELHVGGGYRELSEHHDQAVRLWRRFETQDGWRATVRSYVERAGVATRNGWRVMGDKRLALA